MASTNGARASAILAQSAEVRTWCRHSRNNEKVTTAMANVAVKYVFECHWFSLCLVWFTGMENGPLYKIQFVDNRKFTSADRNCVRA